MKDKLEKFKINKKSINPFDVIESTGSKGQFYTWIAANDPLSGKIYSLKRLARMFLAECPELFAVYEKKYLSLEEAIRVSKINVYEDD